MNLINIAAEQLHNTEEHKYVHKAHHKIVNRKTDSLNLQLLEEIHTGHHVIGQEALSRLDLKYINDELQTVNKNLKQQYQNKDQVNQPVKQRGQIEF